MSLKSLLFPSIKWAVVLAVALMAVIAAGCGSSDSFIIDGRISGGGSATVEFTYYSDGSVRWLTTGAVEGKFRIEGVSATPSLGFITLSGGNPVAALVVADGDHIECEVSPGGVAWKA